MYIHRRRPATKRASSTSAHLLTIVRHLYTSHHSTVRYKLTISERKIDQIESRLGSIETLLKNLSVSGDVSSRIISTPQTGSSGPTCESTADFDSSDEDAAFGGDSGLTVHTAFANEFLERAVKRTSLRSAHPKMEAALANLGQLVGMQKSRSENRQRFPLQRAVPSGGVSKLPLPPMALVVELLKKNKCEWNLVCGWNEC